MLSKIKEALNNARKNKSDNLIFLSTIYSECVMVGKNKRNGLPTDDEVMAVLKKIKKADEETLSAAKQNGRNEIIQKMNLELNVIDSFLPNQLTEEELKHIIQSMINDGLNNIGVIMKELKTRHAGLYDGKMASNLIKSML